MVFLRSKFCPPLSNNTSLRVLSCNIRNFSEFSVGHKNYPSTRCATAANLVYSKQIRALKQIFSHKSNFC